MRTSVTPPCAWRPLCAVAMESGHSRRTDDSPTTTSDTKYDWVPYTPGHRKRNGFIANYETCVAERKRFSGTKWSKPVAYALQSDAFACGVNRSQTLQYNINAYLILQAFMELIGETGELSTMHERWVDFDRTKSRVEDKRKLLEPLAAHSAKRDAFIEVYDALVRQVVIPQIVKAQESALPSTSLPINIVHYASFPCVRVQQPSDFHTIRAHVDSMYGHGPCSVNCWLPLTELDTTGGNSLFVESFPGAEDFEPIQVKVGQIKLFDGASCSHFTVANTSNKTRVSLDFRVVVDDLFRFTENNDESIKSIKTNANDVDESLHYRVGGYFSSAQLNRETGEWKRVTSGKPCIKHGFPHSNKEEVG